MCMREMLLKDAFKGYPTRKIADFASESRGDLL